MMSTLPTLCYPVIVEGKYDKIKLDSLFLGKILSCDGFGIFADKEFTSLLRQLVQRTPLLVLTDSDGAGLVIRNHLNCILPKDRLIHLYTPCIAGKERRKSAPSKAGLLGVEGMEADLLRTLLAPYCTHTPPHTPSEPLSKADLYEWGLSGTADSAQRRLRLCEHLQIPTQISAKALLCYLQLLFSRNECIELFQSLRFLH